MGTDREQPRIGDTMQTKVKHPYPVTISVKLDTEAACKYAAKVLAKPGSGFVLIRAAAMPEGGQG